MMSDSHPKCGALTWTQQKQTNKQKKVFPKHLLHPPTRVSLVRGSPSSSFYSTQPREPLTCQMWPQTQG